LTKHNKEFLVFYLTREYGSTVWVTAKDKLEARRKARRKGRFGIRVFKNRKDIERIENKVDRMWLTNIFTKVKEGHFVYEMEDFDRALASK
jgi:limonene-1,2-epoxide hydrolase